MTPLLGEYGFLTVYDGITEEEARRRVQHMAKLFHIREFQFYDAFRGYSTPPTPGDDFWHNKAFSRPVERSILLAYIDEIKLQGGRSWLYVQAAGSRHDDAVLQNGFVMAGEFVVDNRPLLDAMAPNGAWAQRIGPRWADFAAELGFSGIHWDTLGKFSNLMESSTDLPGFLRAAKPIVEAKGLEQSANFVDGFGWDASLLDDTQVGGRTISFPYFETWSIPDIEDFFYTYVVPTGGGVFVCYPGKSETHQGEFQNKLFAGVWPFDLMIQRWIKAHQSGNSYLAIGDGIRHVVTQYFPANDGISRPDVEKIRRMVFNEPTSDADFETNVGMQTSPAPMWPPTTQFAPLRSVAGTVKKSDVDSSGSEVSHERTTLEHSGGAAAAASDKGAKHDKGGEAVADDEDAKQHNDGDAGAAGDKGAKHHGDGEAVASSDKGAKHDRGGEAVADDEGAKRQNHGKAGAAGDKGAKHHGDGEAVALSDKGAKHDRGGEAVADDEGAKRHNDGKAGAAGDKGAKHHGDGEAVALSDKDAKDDRGGEAVADDEGAKRHNHGKAGAAGDKGAKHHGDGEAVASSEGAKHHGGGEAAASGDEGAKHHGDEAAATGTHASEKDAKHGRGGKAGGGEKGDEKQTGGKAGDDGDQGARHRGGSGVVAVGDEGAEHHGSDAAAAAGDLRAEHHNGGKTAALGEGKRGSAETSRGAGTPAGTELTIGTSASASTAASTVVDPLGGMAAGSQVWTPPALPTVPPIPEYIPPTLPPMPTIFPIAPLPSAPLTMAPMPTVGQFSLPDAESADPTGRAYDVRGRASTRASAEAFACAAALAAGVVGTAMLCVAVRTESAWLRCRRSSGSQRSHRVRPEATNERTAMLLPVDMCETGEGAEE